MNQPGYVIIRYRPAYRGKPGLPADSLLVPPVTWTRILNLTSYLPVPWMHIGSLSCALIAFSEELLSKLHIRLGL